MRTRVAANSAFLTPSLMLKAANLHRDFAAVVERSLDLLWLGRQRRSAADFRLRQIAGGSDVALVTGTITDAALCLPCIAKKSGVPTEEVNALLRAIARNLRLAVGIRQCAACLETKTTFGINTNGHPKDTEKEPGQV